MIKAFCFDVVGTIVDWRGSISKALGNGNNKALVSDWAAYYSGIPFRSNFDLESKGRVLLKKYGLLNRFTPSQLEEFCSIWTRLTPWPNAIVHLEALRKDFFVVALTNCSYETIYHLSKNVGLPWDMILSAERVGVKKPNGKVYNMAATKLSLDPSEIMMVAAHRFDLAGAKEQGFRTAFIQRGDDKSPVDGEVDHIITSLLELRAFHSNV